MPVNADLRIPGLSGNLLVSTLQFIRRVLKELGITGPNDPRVAMTLSKGKWRITFASWYIILVDDSELILTLNESGGDKLPHDRIWHVFARDPSYKQYVFAVTMVESDSFFEACRPSFNQLRDKFKKASHVNVQAAKANQSELLQAVFGES